MFPSGEQHEISFGALRATVVEVGGGIRAFDDGDRHVLEPYDLTRMCDGGHGAPLIPWPNRIAGGRYRFARAEHQLALSEPSRQNAIHGLLRWRNWRLLDRDDDRARVGIRLHPETGWPFPLDAEIEYSLGEDGLAVTTVITNVGEGEAPLATGQHPYLWPGPDGVNGATLAFAAATRILTEPEHAVPAGSEPAAGDFDFRGGQLIGERKLDDAFTDLDRDGDGRAWVTLTGTDGRTVALWADRSYEVLQVFTGDTLAPARRRTGLAVEPMSAPANALQSGERLVVLAPGERWTGSWGVSCR